MNTQTMLNSTRGALVATAFAAAGFIAIPANAETYYLTNGINIAKADVWTNSTGTATTLRDDIAAVDHADDYFVIDNTAGWIVNTNGNGNANSQDHYFNTHIGFQGWARLMFYGQSLDGCTLHFNGNSHLYFNGPSTNPSEMPSVKSNASIIVNGGTHGGPSRIRARKDSSNWVDNQGLELKCPISGNGFLCLTYTDVPKMMPIVLNPQTEGGNSNFTGALHIMGATNSLGEAQLQEVRVMTPDALGGELDADAPSGYGLELDYAKLVVSADVTTSASRVLYIPNDSEISVVEGKTLAVAGRRWLPGGKTLTKSGKGTLELRGGVFLGTGEIIVEEGTLKVGCSGERVDLQGVIVSSNATLEVAESNAMLNGHIALDGGTLRLADNVSVVSNGTELAGDKGIYIKPRSTSSIVLGENAELDIRGLETWGGSMLNITAPESAKVRLLEYVYNPYWTEETGWGLAHITYNGKMAVIGEDFTLGHIDHDAYFDIGDVVALKAGSVTLDSIQATWLNCCIDCAAANTKATVSSAAANLTRKEFDDACLLNVDIADGTYSFGVTRFEILRNYENSEKRIALGDYAKIYVRLERSNPVGNWANGHVQIYASSAPGDLESNPTDVVVWLEKAEDDETEADLGAWEVKEAHVYYPLAVEEGDVPPAFFKAKLVPDEWKE